MRLGDLHEAEMVVGWKKRLPDEERELLQHLGARFVALPHSAAGLMPSRLCVALTARSALTATTSTFLNSCLAPRSSLRYRSYQGPFSL